MATDALSSLSDSNARHAMHMAAPHEGARADDKALSYRPLRRRPMRRHDPASYSGSATAAQAR